MTDLHTKTKTSMSERRLLVMADASRGARGTLQIAQHHSFVGLAQPAIAEAAQHRRDKVIAPFSKGDHAAWPSADGDRMDEPSAIRKTAISTHQTDYSLTKLRG